MLFVVYRRKKVAHAGKSKGGKASSLFCVVSNLTKIVVLSPLSQGPVLAGTLAHQTGGSCPAGAASSSLPCERVWRQEEVATARPPEPFSEQG